MTQSAAMTAPEVGPDQRAGNQNTDRRVAAGCLSVAVAVRAGCRWHFEAWFEV
jgi:hypothetical protein